MDSHVEEIAVDTIGTAVEPVTVEGRSSEIESVETITFDSAIAPVVPQPRRGRPMQKARFAWGLLLSTGGIGLAFVMMLMVFATWNDLVNLRVVEFFSNLLS